VIAVSSTRLNFNRVAVSGESLLSQAFQHATLPSSTFFLINLLRGFEFARYLLTARERCNGFAGAASNAFLQFCARNFAVHASQTTLREDSASIGERVQ
jgi:hypothetical protein